MTENPDYNRELVETARNRTLVAGVAAKPTRKAAIINLFLCWCLTSTEARWPIRDGDRVGRGRQSEGSTAETARKRPERPWTAARTIINMISAVAQ